MWVLSAFILVILLVFAAFMLFSPGFSEDYDIHLPEASDSTAISSGQIQNRFDYPLIDVTPDNVQAVIRTLNQPDSYIRTMLIERFWDGGSSQSLVSVWARGGLLKVSEQFADSVVNYLFDGNTLTMWYDSSSALYQYQDGTSEMYIRLQHIPDCLSLLEINRERILDSGYIPVDGTYRLMVAVESEVFSYKDIFYLSLETGLPEKMEEFDGERLIYRMTSVSTELTAPDDEAFLIPSDLAE